MARTDGDKDASENFWWLVSCLIQGDGHGVLEYLDGKGSVGAYSTKYSRTSIP